MIVSRGEKMLLKICLQIEEKISHDYLSYVERWDMRSEYAKELFEPVLNTVTGEFDPQSNSQYYAVLLEHPKEVEESFEDIFNKGKKLILEYLGDKIKNIHFNK
jgi:hypothetical protein